MKRNTLKIILTVLFAGLTVFGFALYLYEVFVKLIPPSQNLLKLVFLEMAGIVGLIKLYGGGNKKRRSLLFYESQYANELRDAFINDPDCRKTLISAVRLYNENRFDAAIKILEPLAMQCESHSDLYAVRLFTALAYTDMGSNEAAVSIYENMIRRGLSSATVYGNLGSLYSSLGRKDEAIDVFNLAIETDPTAHIAYNNLAQLEFKLGDFESAKEHAKRAVEINFKSRQAASLLSIIYAIEENDEEEKRYTQIAISAGEDSMKLQRAKVYYKSLNGADEQDRDSDEE